MHSASATQRHECTHESSLQCTTNRKPRFRCNAKSGNVPRRPVPRAVPRKLVVQVELTGFEPRMLATQPGPSSPRSNCVKGEVTSGHGCLFATSNVVINETHAGPLAPVPNCEHSLSKTIGVGGWELNDTSARTRVHCNARPTGSHASAVMPNPVMYRDDRSPALYRGN